MITRSVALLSCAVLLTGCVQRGKVKQLEAVARDWCLTIRASQVIPVYPLTEDLQPGDVFLVLESSQNQHRQYIAKGFLPLDQHMTRLLDVDYARPYQKSFGIGDYKDTPHHWQFPATEWAMAPRAAFPTYTFTVESGAGASVAIPIQSVPIGLSMIRSGRAAGSVSIADTYTYGVSFDELVDKLHAWAGRPDMREMLREIRAANLEQPIYLRVVNRVYLTGSVVVSLENTTSAGARADAGTAKDFDLPRLSDSGASVSSHAATLAAINEAIDAAEVGGMVKVAWATNRSVSMSETFDRPLVIGYLGFDFPVLAGGELGTPVATRDQILGKQMPTGKLARDSYLLARGAVESLPDAERDKIYEAAATQIDPSFDEAFKKARRDGDAVVVAFARAKVGDPITRKISPAESLRQITVALRGAYREREAR